MSRSLWDETSIGTLKCKNRFLKGAFHERAATIDGYVTPELLKYYEEEAKGGVGTIILGYARVMGHDFPNYQMMAAYDDSYIPGLRKLAEVIHANGASVIMQIAYGGSRTSVTDDGRLIWGPSDVPNQRTGITPTPMTKEDIAVLVDVFAQAALRGKKAGMDAVMIHSAHGYLLSEWMCPHYNKRTDEYGGSVENRARIVVEIIRAIRELCGQDYPVLLKYNSQDYMEDGFTEDESLEYARILEAAGIDALEISGGNETNPDVAAADLGPSRKKLARHPERTTYFADYARKLRKEVSVPIILTGGNRWYGVMDGVLQEGAADYFGLARPLNSEPDLINKWREDESLEARCVACNKCFVTVNHECILNPTTKLLNA